MKAKKKPAKYKISPIEKKSIIVTTTYKTGKPFVYHEGDKLISIEETFRWGYAVVEANKKDLTKQSEIMVSDYNMIDHSYEDCSALFWDYPDDMSDEEKENIENAFDEDGEDGLGKLGWFYFDNADKILAPFNIDKTE